MLQAQGDRVLKGWCGLGAALTPQGAGIPPTRRELEPCSRETSLQLPGPSSVLAVTHGTAVFSEPFLPVSEEACLHGSPLQSLPLNMPFENDAQWDVCTFVITKTRLVFHNLCLLISQLQEGK